MKDPYEILGVSRTATDEEVKNAYRELAKKYHPDAYADNPLSDLAAEKMQEINEAYDKIISSRRHGRSSSAKGGFYNSGGNFADVRNMIEAGKIEQAQEVLDGIPPEKRDAEWYFLNGTVLYRRGWFDNAFTSFATACRMDPSNPEYRAAFARAQRAGKGFTNNPYRSSANMGGSGVDVCSVCETLWCADCCCECMGGDLIRCC